MGGTPSWAKGERCQKDMETKKTLRRHLNLLQPSGKNGSTGGVQILRGREGGRKAWGERATSYNAATQSVVSDLLSGGRSKRGRLSTRGGMREIRRALTLRAAKVKERFNAEKGPPGEGSTTQHCVIRRDLLGRKGRLDCSKNHEYRIAGNREKGFQEKGGGKGGTRA